jgi:hypothetical protein
MANKFLLQTGTAIVLADTTDHSPAAPNNLGTRTDQIDWTSLAAQAARQSDKIDFGATRARLWNCIVAFEVATTPVLGEKFEIYLAPSTSITPGTANPAGVVGADGAYDGLGSNLDECLPQLLLIGAAPMSTDSDTSGIQVVEVGVFMPPERYGTIVVKNGSATDIMHSDMVEASILLSPIEDLSEAI